MKVKRIVAVYFSAVGNTKLVAEKTVEILAESLKVPTERVDFTLPEAREMSRHFGPEDLVVFGTPTYAGRIPNKVLPYVQTLFSGEKTPTIALVTFGNRNFDSSLTELAQELSKTGFSVFAAGGVACSHVFSPAIGTGRPDEEDMALLKAFALAAVDKLEKAASAEELSAPVIREGAPVAPYYTPLGLDGQPAKFLKAKPVTDESLCNSCGLCVQVCPMASVSYEDPKEVTGVCIKCQACIKACPSGAKYFDDAAFLSHVAMLEKNYADRREAEYYI